MTAAERYADQRAHDVADMTAAGREAYGARLAEVDASVRQAAAIQLVPLPGITGTWDVVTDAGKVGTWQRTDAGAELTDTAGECVAVVSALAGSPCAVVAGLGREAARWSDLAHAVLAGRCEIVPADVAS